MKSDLSNTAPDRIAQLMNYINSHYSECLYLPDLADMLYISPNYLSKLFKKYSGETLTQYLEDLRMIDAKYKLKNTSCPIWKIGAQIGYPNPSYFCRVFKKHFRMTPRQWRNNSVVSAPRSLAELIHKEAYFHS